MRPEAARGKCCPFWMEESSISIKTLNPFRGGSTIRSTQIPDSLLAVNSAMDNGQADSLTEVLQIDPECCNLLAVPANLFFEA